jgi:ATP-dependent RNA helicase RhlE
VTDRGRAAQYARRAGGAGAAPGRRGRKRELLAHLVKTNDWKQVLVFCKTKHGANRLASSSRARASTPTRSTATRARTRARAR